MRTLYTVGVIAFSLLVNTGTASAQRPNTRDGFWIGFGLGGGSVGLDCNSCSDDRVSGGSGYLRMGGTVSPHVLLGGEATAWSKSEDGVDESVGFGSFIVSVYPSATGAFFLKAGIGGMTFTSDDGITELTAKAPALSFGLGYDIRLGDNFSLTPYFNALASGPVSYRENGIAVPTGQEIKMSLAQIGLGFHWH